MAAPDSNDLVPRGLIDLLLALLLPVGETVYDPNCGTGELLIALDATTLGTSTLYGQVSEFRQWDSCRRRFEASGSDVNLGDGPAAPFNTDHHRELRARTIASVIPVQSGADNSAATASLAWVPFCLDHLADGGVAALVLPYGTFFRGVAREQRMREALISAGVLECLVALPSRLLPWGALPLGVWVFRGGGSRRPGHIHMIDARRVGARQTNSSVKVLGGDDVAQIVYPYRGYLAGDALTANVAGFSSVTSIAEIEGPEFVLNPARYV